MDKIELIEVVATLYAALPVFSSYAVPEEVPEVHVLPTLILQDLVCAAPCHIKAVYHPDFGLMLSDADTALRFERLFGMSAQLWLHLQAQYNQELATLELSLNRHPAARVA